jgi:hypothetical protein
MHLSAVMSCQCHARASHVHVHSERAPRPPRQWREASITLVHGDRSALVRPASLPARHFRGALSVQLDDLWAAAHLPGDLLALAFDFLGEDGYRPSKNGWPPVPGPLLERGYLQLETGRVQWEESTELECSYHVKGVTMIIALDAAR